MKWINPDTFEKDFGVKQSTQKSWRLKGMLPYSKIGNFIFYDIEKIFKLLEENTILNLESLTKSLTS